jgi:hypothetical protein
LKFIPRTLVIISALIFLHTANVCSQVLPVNFANSFYPGKEKLETGNSTLPIGIGVASFLYLLNPIAIFQNDRIGGGLTKEISLGFGYFGEHRFAAEYSYIFREGSSSHFRLGYKYDILLKDKLRPSNLLQGTSVISLGASYFYDLEYHGVSPEISYGYSIRNDKLLIYPNLKLRYTYIPEGASMVDFSLGFMIGFANPFIDLKIRTKNNPGK